ncbi:hypothetical protein J6590_027544 [Homalodisca vitripennis]|nr:hypothetical protein J6590_027544 [Homalodisca vitripennis]
MQRLAVLEECGERRLLIGHSSGMTSSALLLQVIIIKRDMSSAYRESMLKNTFHCELLELEMKKSFTQ